MCLPHRNSVLLILVVAGIFTLDCIRLATGLTDAPKDFVIFPLAARAALSGLSPYLPLPRLAEIFQSDVLLDRLPHPSPYPPPSLVVGFPLIPLTYKQSAFVWLTFGIISLVIALLLLYRVSDKNKNIGLLLLLFATWHPVFLDLGYGQVMIPLLLLTVLLWLTLRSGRSVIAGLLLGTLLAFKLFAWPVLLYLLIRRDWLTSLIAIGLCMVANVSIAFWIGFDVVIDYYLHIGGEVAQFYQHDPANFSPLTIGPRLMSSVMAALPLSITSMLLLFCVGIYLAMRSNHPDHAFGVLVCVSLIVNPVAWRHYLVLLIIPAVIIGLSFTRQVTRARLIGTALLILLALPMGHIYELLPSSLLGRAAGLLPLVLIASVGYLSFATSRQAEPVLIV